jgi:phosphatidylserine/phosphatidylglycerophosphate/cardiolipin synthase-like enzyme
VLLDDVAYTGGRAVNTRNGFAREFAFPNMRKSVLHSKIAVVDDTWSTVGTFNINPTSVACVHELNVVVNEPSFVAEVARRIEIDLESSCPVTLTDVQSWPFAVRACRGI